jgi:hypothetical protein
MTESALVHMNMLNPHELRAAMTEAAQGFYLGSVGTQQSARRGHLAFLDDRDRPRQPSTQMRPLNRKVAEFIRANSPADIDGVRITQALDVLESPWPRREELMLREWYAEETCAGATKALYLIDKILETGLEPFREPPTLAPIRLDEVELVCWMAICFVETRESVPSRCVARRPAVFDSTF